MLKERGRAQGLAIAGFIIVYSFGIGALMNAAFRIFGVRVMNDATNARSAAPNSRTRSATLVPALARLRDGALPALRLRIRPGRTGASFFRRLLSRRKTDATAASR